MPWLVKLLEDLAKVDSDEDREEVRRQLLQLVTFISCLASLAYTDQIPYRSLKDARTRSLDVRNNCAERE